jgi:hypothetical protein
MERFEEKAIETLRFFYSFKSSYNLPEEREAVAILERRYAEDPGGHLLEELQMI